MMGGTYSIAPNGTGGYISFTDQTLSPLFLQAYNDFHDGSDWFPLFEAWFWQGECYNTFNGVKVGSYYFCGGYHAPIGPNEAWSWGAVQPDGSFGIGIIGSLPAGGGDGVFVMSIVTPEPSSLYLLGSGFVGVLGFLRKRLTK